LDKVQEGKSSATILFGDAHHQAKIGPDHVRSCFIWTQPVDPRHGMPGDGSVPQP